MSKPRKRKSVLLAELCVMLSWGSGPCAFFLLWNQFAERLSDACSAERRAGIYIFTQLLARLYDMVDRSIAGQEDEGDT
jgi:hypothetical protein